MTIYPEALWLPAAAMPVASAPAIDRLWPFRGCVMDAVKLNAPMPYMSVSNVSTN